MMSPDRIRLLRLAGLALGGCLLLALMWFFLIGPWLDYDQKVSDLNAQISKTNLAIAQKVRDRKELETFRHISLPTSMDVAVREYDRYLNKLLTENGFKDIDLHVSVPGAGRVQAKAVGAKKDEPIYQALIGDVHAVASVANLIKVLGLINREPMLQRVKTMSVERADTKSQKDVRSLDLKVTLQMEALVVQGADFRPPNLEGPDERLVQLDVLTGLRGGAPGLASLTWMVGPTGVFDRVKREKQAAYRDYNTIVRNNIFEGLLPKETIVVQPQEDSLDTRQFTYLIAITRNDKGTSALLRNRLAQVRGEYIRLSSAGVFSQFSLRDEYGQKVVMKGKVVRIDLRDVYFECNSSVYRLHMGQTLADALHEPLSEEAILQIGLKGSQDD
jgi:hypothetical protein